MTTDLNHVRIFEVGDYDAHIARAHAVLREGGLAVLPTETVYGVAGILTRQPAMDRLRALTPGAPARPFVVHLAHRDEALRYLGDLDDLGRRMMRKLWPGPVALVFDVLADRRAEVAAELRVGESDIYADGAITLRSPDHIVTIDVLQSVGPAEPVVMRRLPESMDTLVNAAGEPALADQFDLVLDAGPPRHSKPSTIVKMRPGGYDILRAGIYDQRIIERLLRTTVLFVCSGNTCRSPMAESIARSVMAKKLNVNESELDHRGVTVMSAGSMAMPGARATPAAVEALKPMGLDISRHRSRPLTVELIHQADLILTMGRSHTAAVKALVPSAAEKTRSLDPQQDIEDPIGGDVAVYVRLAGSLAGLIEKRLDEKPLF